MKAKKKTIVFVIIGLYLVIGVMPSIADCPTEIYTKTVSIEKKIEQHQTDINHAAVICSWYKWAQSFIATNDTINSVKLPFFRTGFIRSDIQISIKKDLNEEDLTTKSISYDQVPWGIRYRRFEWVSVDLPDIPVSIGETYYITVYTDGGFGKQFAWFGSYAWGASKNPESYVDGESWYSYVKGTSSTQWTIWDPPFDFCFQIFSNDS